MRRVAKGAENDAKNEPKRVPRRTNRSPRGAQREAWDSLGHPCGGSGASGPKTTTGNQFFRIKNAPDFRGPGEEFSMIFITNFRLEFSLIFDAVFTAKLASKSQPKGGQGCQMPGQSLP